MLFSCLGRISFGHEVRLFPIWRRIWWLAYYHFASLRLGILRTRKVSCESCEMEALLWCRCPRGRASGDRGGHSIVTCGHSGHRRHDATFPVATFLDGLLAILHIVERSPNRWREAKQGNATVVGKLELVAVCAERYLFRNIESPDLVTASHLRNKATGIAASFRSLKVSVLTAETYTRSIFTERIKSDITNAVNNNWDALIRPEAEGFQMLQDRKSSYRWLANLGTAARTLLSGGVPLVLLFVLKAKGIALAEPLNTYVTIGAYLWAFVTVLSVLDPLFAQKLAQVKRIKDFLPGKKDEMEI